MPKNKISKNWINKQRRDLYVRMSKKEGYRSRAVFKLKEIDQKGAFYADDEIGWFFEEVKKIQEALNEFRMR